MKRKTIGCPSGLSTSEAQAALAQNSQSNFEFIQPESKTRAKTLRLVTGWLCFLVLTFAVSAFGQGIITTVAGNGLQGYNNSDGIQATQAWLNDPSAVAIDSFGNLYIADTSNCRVRAVNVFGIISTLAGTGTGSGVGCGYNGDGVQANTAQLNYPTGVAVDTAGNVYIADKINNRVRMVNTSTGIISTVAGNGNLGNLGDGGVAANAELNNPYAVAVDSKGNLYIDDSGNDRIRKASSGTITAFAGNGTVGFAGDGGAAVNAELNGPDGVAVDPSGNVYISDQSNSRIRKVNTAGTISTAAGTGAIGQDNGDGGLATKARLNFPNNVAVDSFGNFYISDIARVRQVNAAGIITTVAGDGANGYAGDGGPATMAELNNAFGMTVDSAGNLYIADEANQRIRKSAVMQPCLSAEYDTADNNIDQIHFLSFDSNLYEITSSGHFGTFAKQTGVNGAPSVASPGCSLTSYVNTIYNGNEAFYLTLDSKGNQDVEQLWGATYSPTNLSLLPGSGAKPAAPGSSLVGFIDTTANTDNVFFLGTDKFVHVLTWSPSKAWQEDSILDGTKITAAVVGSPLTGHLTSTGEEVFYFGTNHHVYQLYRSSSVDAWASTDITSKATGKVALAGSPLASFYDSNGKNDVVVYIGTNQHVYELYYLASAGKWQSADLTMASGAPNAVVGSTLAAHINSNNGGSEEIYFLDSNQDVREMWSWSTTPTVWNLNPYNAGSPSAAPESPISTNFNNSTETDEVFYIGSNGHVYELFTSQDVTNAASAPNAVP